MTRSDPSDSDGRLRGDEPVKLPRNSRKRRYGQEIDISARQTDFRQCIVGEIPPPQSLRRQLRKALSIGWRRLQWDWLAPLKQPWIIALLSLTLVATIVLVLVHHLLHEGPSPSGTQGAEQAAGSSSSSVTSPHRPYQKRLIADQMPSRHVRGDNNEAGSTGGEQHLSRHPPGKPANDKPLTVYVTIGGSGALVSVNITVPDPKADAIPLQASLGVAVDPTSAACQPTHLDTSDPGIPNLLAALKAPLLARFQAGLGHPLTIQLSPTGVPSHPLGCSVTSPGGSSGTPVVAGNSSSLLGTAGDILGSVSSIPLLQQH
jgi:hypothetical protein